MTWWQVAVVFAGIPAAAFGLIWVIVAFLCDAREPDGLAAARRERAGTPGRQHGQDPSR